MFNNFKIKIKELAKSAVNNAEEILGSNKGKQKKEMAIKFVIEKLPVPIVLKPIISIMFSSFIDEAIDFAVTYMKRQA